MCLASPETGIELLKSWNEVDQSKHQISIRPAVFILGQYAPVVASQPSPDLAKRVLVQFSEAKTRDIRLSLIELMGLLLPRFPDLRDELLRIMREDPDNEVRGQALLALATHNAAAALPAIVERLEVLLQADGKSDVTKELMCLVDFLVKALPLDQVLDRLKDAADKATGLSAVSNLNTLGFSLGNASGATGSLGFEILMTRGAVETSRNMQLIYLGALGGVALRENKDPRATDLALAYLESSSDDWVRMHALSMVTALNRDEPTVLGAIEKALKSGGTLASTGGMQLAFYYYIKNPASAAALEMVRRHVTTGEKEARLVILKRLCVSAAPMPATVREIVKTVSESDPDSDICAMAVKVLNWTGGPPPR